MSELIQFAHFTRKERLEIAKFSKKKRAITAAFGGIILTVFILLNSPVLFIFNPKYVAAKERILDLGTRLQVDSHTLFYEPFIAELSKEYNVNRTIWYHKELNLTKDCNQWSFTLDLNDNYDFIKFGIEGDEVGLVERIEACYVINKLYPFVEPCVTIYQR